MRDKNSKNRSAIYGQDDLNFKQKLTLNAHGVAVVNKLPFFRSMTIFPSIACFPKPVPAKVLKRLRPFLSASSGSVCKLAVLTAFFFC